MKKKILVAMSGGVDSTVVAYLLQKDGFEIEGVYMKLHDSPEYHEKNIQNVKKVANYLGIKHHILDLSSEFLKDVYTPFIKGYEAGLTPNPCVVCNRNIKLGALLDFTKKMGFDALATGHYARIKDGFIQEADDKSKDQSYFLSNIKLSSLDSVIFPLGDMLKNDVVKIAQEIDVLEEIAKQKESSEICFVEDSYLDVLKEHINIEREGDVLDSEGNIIGEHRGYMHYTIGQRKGFTLKVAHTPHYVLKIDAKNNTITVGKRDELDVDRFEVIDLNMFIDKESFDCEVKVRYKSPKVPAFVEVKNKSAIIALSKSIQGLAPGQAAVFYNGDIVIGSGWIKKEII
jgi:tRNA-specific 2-thiouridylase